MSLFTRRVFRQSVIIAWSIIVRSSSAAPTAAPTTSNETVFSCTFDEPQSLCGFHNTGSFDWATTSGSTPSLGTGPEADHTTGTGSYVYVEASLPNFPFIGPYTLEATLDQKGAGGVSFWYTMYGLGTGSLTFDFSIDGVAWISKWTKSGNQGISWQRANFRLDDPAVAHIRFTATTGSDFVGDTAIDDVVLTQGAMSSNPTASPAPSTSFIPTSSPTPPPSFSPSTLGITTGRQLQSAATVQNVTANLDGDIRLDSTIVIAGTKGVTVNGQSSFQINGQDLHSGFYITNGAEVTLRDLNVTHCVDVGNGGGITVIQSSLELRNVTVSHCESPAGGGLHVFDSRVYISRCIFRNNAAEGGGGILMSYQAHVFMVETVLSENSAPGGSGFGGGIEVRESTVLEAKHCEFTGNVADGGGGGAIYAYGGGIAVITSSNFVSNRALDSSGGAILATSSSIVNLTDVVFDGNSALGAPLGNVTAGSCTVSGDCFTSPNFPSPYGSDEYCRIEIFKDAILEAEAFDIQSGFDFLTIDSVLFTGGAVPVSEGSVVEFTSDATTGATGFQMCTEHHSDGGGLFASFSSTVTLLSTSLNNNTASSRGGGALASESAVILFKASQISGNLAGALGGGLYIDSAFVFFERTSLTHNLASNGEDMYLLAGSFSGADVYSTGKFDGPFLETGATCTPSCPAGLYGDCTQALSAPLCYINCGTTCLKCESGTYSTTTSSVSAQDCKPCPGGSVSSSGAAACSACVEGTYASNSPLDTGGGQSFQVLSGATSCKKTHHERCDA